MVDSVFCCVFVFAEEGWFMQLRTAAVSSTA
uniref:Uncharacterized protein n=1 Tax=Arundo donax TaxID=35708 RepID=A0A0A8Z0Q9_ARUDO